MSLFNELFGFDLFGATEAQAPVARVESDDLKSQRLLVENMSIQGVSRDLKVRADQLAQLRREQDKLYRMIHSAPIGAGRGTP